MVGTHLRVGAGGRRRDRLLRRRNQRALRLDLGRRGQQQRDRFGILDHERVPVGAYAAALGNRLQGRGEAHSGLPLVGLARVLGIRERLPFHDDPIRPGRTHHGARFPRQLRREADLSPSALCDSDDDRLIDRRGERLACVGRSVNRKGDACDRGAEIELALIFGGGARRGKAQGEIAERLVRRHPPRRGDDRLVRERFGFHRLPRQEEPPHFRHGGGTRGVQAIPLLPGPDRIFVELQPLVGDAAEDHGAEATVSDRERLVPIGRRLAVPEAQIRVLLDLVAAAFPGKKQRQQPQNGEPPH